MHHSRVKGHDLQHTCSTWHHTGPGLCNALSSSRGTPVMSMARYMLASANTKWKKE